MRGDNGLLDDSPKPLLVFLPAQDGLSLVELLNSWQSRFLADREGAAEDRASCALLAQT